MGNSELFSKQAQDYARFRPRYPQALYEYLSTLVPGRSLVWDAATGSGQAAVTLAEFFDRVVATDLSADQIRHAHPNPKVEYRVEKAEQVSLTDASVDLVTVAQAVHWFDLDLFYSEVRRVSRPGGVLAVFGYAFFEPFAIPTVDLAIEEFCFKTLGPHWQPQLKLLWSRYAGLPFPFQEERSPDFFIETEASLDELMGYFSTWSAVPLYRQANLGKDPIAELRAKVLDDWGDPEERRKLVWKIPMRVGRVS